MTPFDREAGDVRHYLDVFRRQRWIIVACAILGALLATAYSFSQQKVYESSAVLIFQSASSSGIARQGLADSSLTQAAAAQVEAQLFDSQVVQDAAAAELNDSASVNAVILDEAIGLEIIATAKSPEVAARAANVYAQAYSKERIRAAVNDANTARGVVEEQLSEVDTQLKSVQAQLSGESAAANGPEAAESQLTDELASLSAQKFALEQRLDALALVGSGDGPQVVSPAEVNPSPTSPKPIRNFVAGLVAGLVLGLGLALLRDRLDEKVRSEADLRDVIGDLPVLATVPHVKVQERGEFIALTNADAQGVIEPLRVVRSALQYISIDRPIRRLLVTSPSPGDGKSTLALNLALSSARAGKRTVLIDTDLRRPRLSTFIGHPNTRGLTSVLIGETPLVDSVVNLPGEKNLVLLPTGPTPPGSSERIESDRTRCVIDEIASQADLTVLDAPPVLTVADALALAGMVDAVVLVARSGKTKRRELVEAIDRLDQVGAPVIGAVLNDGRPRPAYGEYYYAAGPDEVPPGSPPSNPPSFTGEEDIPPSLLVPPPYPQSAG